MKKLFVICFLLLFGTCNICFAEISAELLQKAESGNAESQLVLGNAYHFGEGVEQDYDSAVHWYLLAAKQDNSNAIKWITELAWWGYGFNEREFNELLQLAETGMYPWSYYIVGRAYLLGGMGTTRNYAEAFKWFSKGADADDKRSIDAFSGYYENGIIIYDVDNLLELAENGDLDAQLKLAKYYWENQSFQKYYFEKIKWLQRAAEQGDASAMYDLYVAYTVGHPRYKIETDNEKAIFWLRKSSELNYFPAQYNLANLYVEGDIIDQDYEAAIKLYHSCIKGGDIIVRLYSLYSLAQLYSNTQYTDYNYEKAIKIYMQILEIDASSESFEFDKLLKSSAYYHLGDFYQEGKGVGKNNDIARRMYEKSLEMTPEFAPALEKLEDLDIQ